MLHYLCVETTTTRQRQSTEGETMHAVPSCAYPSDADLDVWIDQEGRHVSAFLNDAESIIADLIRGGEITVYDTVVPYGSTMASLGEEYDPDDVPTAALRAVAYTWWEGKQIGWNADGDYLVTNNDVRSEER